MLDWSKKIKAQRPFNAIKFFKIFDGISEIKQNKMKRTKNGLWDMMSLKVTTSRNMGFYNHIKYILVPWDYSTKIKIK